MIAREFEHDTIAAIATASGEGGIGIVRLSGKDAVSIADKMFKSNQGNPVRSQKGFTAQYGHVVSQDLGADTRIIDEAVLLLMRAPKSYTAEDVVEIQVHGGNVVLREVLALAIGHGARLAGPGEFTKRAFLNGRMDLLQAEAVLDLIQAKTEKSRQWASAQLEGFLSQKMTRIKTTLIEVLSYLEASIDFPEDDLEVGDYTGIAEKISTARSEMKTLLAGSTLGFLAKRGVSVVLWGRPNTGKSSLMNRLSGHNRVIVTPIAGTTRDVVEEEIQLGGFPVRLSDTAGIQDTINPIEKEGVSRSRQAAMGAELILFVLDAGTPLASEDRALFGEISLQPKIIVLNKSDLPKKVRREEILALGPALAVIEISCQTGEGIATLEKQILEWATQGRSEASPESVLTSIRQKDVVEKILAALDTAAKACQAKLSPELVAVDVRLALDQVGVLVGEVVNDDVLEVLFRQFCIGK